MSKEHERKETKRFMDRVLDEGIKPHAREIARRWVDGEIPIVVFEPGVETLKALPNLGWRMGESVFSMTLEHFLTTFGSVDGVTGPWATRDRSGDDSVPVFLFLHDGSLLLNHTPGKGWSLEPGSTDIDIMN